MAWRWSSRNVLSANRARHRSTLAMVIDALAKALVALCRAPSTVAAPVAAISRVSRSGFADCVLRLRRLTPLPVGLLPRVKGGHLSVVREAEIVAAPRQFKPATDVSTHVADTALAVAGFGECSL